MPLTIAAALPIPKRRDGTPPRYSDAFLSYFDALVVRPTTLSLPPHQHYILDARGTNHARAEVLLRRHHPQMTHVLAASRFPHGVLRLRALLLTLSVLDVRPTPTQTNPRRPHAYLLTQPLPIIPDSLAHGWYVPSRDLTDAHRFAQHWLPVLTMVEHALVVLELPWRGEEAALHALDLLRAGQGCTPPAASPMGDAVPESKLPV